MSSGNGNGGRAKPTPEASPLEEVTERLSRVAAEEAAEEGVDSDSVGLNEDILHDWASREHVTLEDLREGLLAVSKIAEAAIESNIKNASEIRKLSGPIQVVSDQVRVIAAKAEVNSDSIDKVDTEFGRVAREVHRLRVSMQGVQVDIARMKEQTSLLPAMKELLGEILARLPSPEPKK